MKHACTFFAIALLVSVSLAPAARGDVRKTGDLYTPVACDNSLTDVAASFGESWNDVTHELPACGVAYAPADETTLLASETSEHRYTVTSAPAVNAPTGNADGITAIALGVGVKDLAGSVAATATAPGGWITSQELPATAEPLLDRNRPVDLLAAWRIAVLNAGDGDGYNSMDLAEGLEHLTLFTYAGGQWFEYAADILEWGAVTYDQDGVLCSIAPVGLSVFGENPEHVVQSAGVPEPATLTLLAMGGLVLLRRR